MAGVRDPRELRNGDFLNVLFIGGQRKYYQIIRVDDIFYHDEHTALASGGTEAFTNINALDPPIDMFHYFYNIMICGNVQLSLKLPASTNRWGTNRSPAGGILNDTLSPMTTGKFIELWCSENYPPAIQLINSTNVTITPVLWWIGKRFSIREVKDSVASVSTAIQIGGIAE
jgi:hypothetical protein